jgi:hypothetical protein
VGIRVTAEEQPRVFLVKAGTRTIGRVTCRQFKRNKNFHSSRAEYLCPVDGKYYHLEWCGSIRAASNKILEHLVGDGKIDEVRRRVAP